MPGFTDHERLTISALCRFHRKSMPQPRHQYFQALDAESKRIVLSLVPLLRIADALDRGHQQKVRNIAASSRDGTIGLSIEADADADLEIWAANKAADAFHEAFGRPVTLQRARQPR